MVAERFADRDDPLLDPVVLDDVDAAGAGDDLDGRRGNEERGCVHGLTDSRRRELPGFSRPSAFDASASTVSARWSARRLGETKRMRASNSSLVYASTVSFTGSPTLTSETDCSGTVARAAADRRGRPLRPWCRA